MKDYPPWTAYRSYDYGYTRMTIHNGTHLYMEQVRVDLVRHLICLRSQDKDDNNNNNNNKKKKKKKKKKNYNNDDINVDEGGHDNKDLKRR